MAARRRVTLRRNGQIALPAEERERAHASQAYFWTEAWQKGEREAQADIRAGRTRRFESAKDLSADLDR